MICTCHGMVLYGMQAPPRAEGAQTILLFFAPAVRLRAQPLSRRAHRRSLESVLPSP